MAVPQIAWLRKLAKDLSSAAQKEPVQFTVAVATVFYAIIATLQWSSMRGQLSEMRSSSEQSEQTLAALKQQAESLRRQADFISESQRPSIYFSKMETTYLPNGIPNEPAGWMLTPRIVNGGNTTSLHLTAATGCALLLQSREDPFAISGIEQSVGIPDVLGPKAESAAPKCLHLLNTAIADGINQGKAHFYVVGKVRYKDSFAGSQWHVTEFEKELAHLSYDHFNLNYEMVNVGLHNCADSDCSDFPESQ